MKIALCPGHTTSKPGARNKKYGFTEHSVAVEVVYLLMEMLEKEGYEVKTFFGNLRAKVSNINRGNFDLALDIHFNADPETEDTDDKKGYGCGVVYYPHSEKRRIQAKIMADAIAKTIGERSIGAIPGYYWGGKTPGKKVDYFLKHTNCPAFIPEPGFIDNNAFCEKFLLTDKQDLIAKGLLEGIKAYERHANI